MNFLTQIQLFPGSGFKGFGPLGLEGGEDAPSTFNKFLSSTIGIMTIIAIIWFIFMFISGAIGIIASGGDKAALEAARKKIATGIVGIVVVIAAVFLIDLIGDLIGIPNILNPAELLKQVLIQ